MLANDPVAHLIARLCQVALVAPMLVMETALAAPLPAPEQTAHPFFTASTNGEFVFNTGVLRGKVRAGGKSLGLTSVVHLPSGKRLDRSNGLLSHYRVFTRGVRYGAGAWDWPSTAVLRADHALEVQWPPVDHRPFELRAVYRWRDATTLDLETVVRAEKELVGFETFIASYFAPTFTNAAVSVAQSPEHDRQAGLLRARAAYGHWLMFPRTAEVVPLIQDGRWKLEPNPVDWTIMPPLAQALAVRRDQSTGLAAVLCSQPADCFAIAMPHETEGHYSVYLSLFGGEVKRGATLRAHVRLIITSNLDDEEILRLSRVPGEKSR